MSTPFDAAANWPHHVYRCYDGAGTLLYIGCTDDVEGRMYHMTAVCNMGKQPNGYLRRRVGPGEFSTRLAARAAERAAIEAEAPLLNRQHNPKRFRKGADGRFEAVASCMTAPSNVVAAVETRDSAAVTAHTPALSDEGEAAGSAGTHFVPALAGDDAAGANAAAAREGRAPWQSSALPRLLWAESSWGRLGSS
jgi:hypothetical protein